jgi:hypothetical protein
LKEGKAYIDNLYQAGRLAPDPNGSEEFRHGGYGGLGIHDADTPEYRELFIYMENTRRQAARDVYPAQAKALFKELKTDPHLFLRRLCGNDAPDNLYVRIPLLASTEPEEFARLVLDQPSNSQRIIFMAFNGRYEYGQLQNDLSPERAWLEKVRCKLIELSKSLPLIGQERLRKNIEWNIDPALGIKAAEATSTTDEELV